MEAVSIVPIKCALTYTPPVLILVYKDEATGKVRRRSMPLRGFKSTTDTTIYADELKRSRNRQYIRVIPEVQLLSLLKKVKDAQDKAVSNIGSSQKNDLSSLQGLPSLSTTSATTPLGVRTHTRTEELLHPPKTKPKLINEEFNFALNQLLKDEDEDSLGSNLQSTNTSQAQDMNEIKFRNPFSTDSLLNSKKGPLQQSPEKSSEDHSRNPSSVEIPDYSPDFNSESDHVQSENDISSPMEELEDEDLSGGERLDVKGKVPQNLQEDLNLISEDQLRERKAEMDILFEANRLRPGDDGYKYDKEIEFEGPKMESAWDSDNSSNLEF